MAKHKVEICGINTSELIVLSNEKMEEFTIEGTELMARAICHELEHLDGHLYTERVEGELVNAEDIMSEEED